MSYIGLTALGLVMVAIDVGGFLASLLAKHSDSQTETQVSIIVGNGPNAGGSVPDIFVKNAWGNRLAMFSGPHNGHLNGGQARSFTFGNDPGIDLITQVGQPHYVALVPNLNDAICVSGITAQGNGASYVWTGDLGFHCGAEWYESDFAFGTNNVPPKCVWLDKDHSNGIVASALHLHMTDFSGGVLRQYQEKNEKGEEIGKARLCKNSARMTFMPEWDYTNFHFFKDPLEFNRTNGEFVHPDLGIDRQEEAYPDGTHLPWKTNSKSKRNDNSTLPDRYSPNKNHLPDHLTISYISAHSARRLCESDTSRGADFVAIHGDEKLFCDMTKKKLIDVCDEKTTQACFDLETKQMRDVGAKIRKRDLSYSNVVPKKSYKSHAVWGQK